VIDFFKMLNNGLLQIQDLNYAFGKGVLQKPVLFDINLEIMSGEIVMLMGPSGSGKTALLTLIGALRGSQQGSLRILEQELNGASKQKLTKIRQQIGFIFQANNLLKCLTAWENVAMSLKFKPTLPASKHRAVAVEMLKAVGLAERVDYYPEKLSGGQQQRVAIARALVNQPKLILADEPTASLDKQSGRAVVELMKTLAKEQNSAILIVTHDNRILDIADRIIHMEDGRLVRG
jgi:putative ABC transport system ATP-binding protein